MFGRGFMLISSNNLKHVDTLYLVCNNGRPECRFANTDGRDFEAEYQGMDSTYKVSLTTTESWLNGDLSEYVCGNTTGVIYVVHKQDPDSFMSIVRHYNQWLKHFCKPNSKEYYESENTINEIIQNMPFFLIVIDNDISKIEDCTNDKNRCISYFKRVKQ